MGSPLVSVVTRIDYDHQEFLGRRLEDIAGEKAGIIRGGTALSAAQAPEAMAVVEARCRAVGVPLLVEGRELDGRDARERPRGPPAAPPRAGMGLRRRPARAARALPARQRRARRRRRPRLRGGVGPAGARGRRAGGVRGRPMARALPGHPRRRGAADARPRRRAQSRRAPRPWPPRSGTTSPGGAWRWSSASRPTRTGPGS